MATYKLFKSPVEGKVVGAIRIDSKISQTCFPFSPDNRDYQQYLKWLEEGNTPQEAE